MWADIGTGVLINLAQLTSIENHGNTIMGYKADGSVALQVSQPESDEGRRAIEERMRRIRRVLQDGRGIADLTNDEAAGMTAADLMRNHERIRAARLRSTS